MGNHRFGKFSLLIGIVYTFIWLCAVCAASDFEPERPKIGLALGGGSAKGLAHIGILMWLEEHRIPVDYVAGTSIGGLVGGCYAMGMSPGEIEDTVRGIDWDRAFAGPPNHVLDFRRKEDRRDYPVDGQIGLKDSKVKLPSGLAAHQVGLVISRITLPYSTLKSFDELPIPYRCVATDIQAAEQVVLGDGSLADAMRATMAIPGVFSPVEREGRVLVDGGVLNNVPADVAKSMGADVVIAVDLNTSVQDRDVNGIDEVLTRTISTVVMENTRRSLKKADLVIAPELDGLTASDWKKVDKFVELGYEAAEKQAAVLSKYSLDQASWDRYLWRRRSRMADADPIVPQAILVIGAQPDNAAGIKNRLKGFLGHPLDKNGLEQALTGLTGTGLYESLRYEWDRIDGVPTLIINVVEKAYGPPFFDFALRLEADGFRADHVDIDTCLRMTSFNVWGEGSEFRADIGLGTELSFRAELYKPFMADGSWFWAPTLSLTQHNSSLFEDDIRVTDYKSATDSLGLELGYAFGKNAEIRFGYWLEYQTARVRVGEPIGYDARGLIHRAGLRWSYMNEDDAILPRQGVDWVAQADWYYDVPGASDPFGRFESRFRWSLPVGREDIFFIHFSDGYSTERNIPLLQQFRLGGPFRLGTYRIEELKGSQYLLMNAGFLKSIGDLPLTGKRVYLGLWYEYGGVFDDWAERDLTGDISVGLISCTVLGPVYIGASYGEGENPWFYVGVGQSF